MKQLTWKNFPTLGNYWFDENEKSVGCDEVLEHINSLEVRVSKLEQAVEYSRQHFYLPQSVLDVFSELVPKYIEFSREEVEGIAEEEDNELNECHKGALKMKTIMDKVLREDKDDE